MVSSIVPGAAGAGALGVDPRFQRNAANGAGAKREDAAPGDRVEVSGASLAMSRESVRAAVNQVHQALAIGHDAQGVLVKVQSLARAGGHGAQGELEATLAAFGARVESALASGALLVAGEDVAVQAEPGGAPVTISGVDLRLKDAPAFGDLIKVPADARIGDQGLAQAAQRSLDALQEAMARLLESARALEAHQGFLGAAEGAGGVRNDLDADGARLLALQVRQGLEAAGARPIANVEPQAVLALFRA
jgi:hypothetical protein